MRNTISRGFIAVSEWVTSKVLLFAIVLGLWAHLVVTFVSYREVPDYSYELGRMNSQLGDIHSTMSKIESDVSSVQSSLRLIELNSTFRR